MALTDIKVKLSRGARTKYVRKAFEDEQVKTKWSQTAWAKRIGRFQRRAELTDFERFKVKVLKQKVLWSFGCELSHICIFPLEVTSG